MLDYITVDSSLRLVIDFVVEQSKRDLQLTVAIRDNSGIVLFNSAPQDVGLSPPEEHGQYRANLYLPKVFTSQTYEIGAYLWIPDLGRFDHIQGLQFSVQETAAWSNNAVRRRHGRLDIQCDWSIESVVEAFD